MVLVAAQALEKNVQQRDLAKTAQRMQEPARVERIGSAHALCVRNCAFEVLHVSIPSSRSPHSSLS